nr:hypothetical protein HK105_004960 [Polyrhizophydium stewartii]
MLCAGSTQKQYKHEDQTALLARITHVAVTGRGIRDMQAVSLCANLSALFLHDNKIETISGLDACHNLTRLYLQNNCIRVISGLDGGGLGRLVVLNLSGNRIKTKVFPD